MRRLTKKQEKAFKALGWTVPDVRFVVRLMADGFLDWGMDGLVPPLMGLLRRQNNIAKSRARGEA